MSFDASLTTGWTFIEDDRNVMTANKDIKFKNKVVNVLISPTAQEYLFDIIKQVNSAADKSKNVSDFKKKLKQLNLDDQVKILRPAPPLPKRPGQVKGNIAYFEAIAITESQAPSQSQNKFPTKQSEEDLELNFDNLPKRDRSGAVGGGSDQIEKSESK